MKNEPEKKSNGADIGLAIMRIWAMTLYAPLRIRMGRDHIGFAGLLGLLLIFFYAGLAKALPLLWLIPLLMLHYACQNWSDFVRRRNGIIEHTQYGGEPWIAMRLLRIKSESAAKQFGEPLIIAALGCLMLSDWPSTANYFLGGAMAMFFNHLVLEDMDRRRFDQMNNMQIEGEYYSQGR